MGGRGVVTLVGADSTKYRDGADEPAEALLERARDDGLDGVAFRSMFELSPTLDPRELADVAATARDLGLRIEGGLGKVNPYATPEAPELRRFGGGDLLAAYRTIIERAASIGVTELWCATANYKFEFDSRFAFDRFRTDVDWAEQLDATAEFLERLAPIARDNGVHLNLETHEEITSREVVALVERVGDDAVGVTFDTANVWVRGEDALAAAHRVAAYVRATHVRDAALVIDGGRMHRFLAAIGEGVVDWHPVIDALSKGARDRGVDLMFSIEGVLKTRGRMAADVHDLDWRAGHPDVTDDELRGVVEAASAYTERGAQGHAPTYDQLSAPVDAAERRRLFERCRDELRSLLATISTENDTDEQPPHPHPLTTRGETR